MPYVALYRKYRSRSFDELMGQDHVTRTLRNALRADRLAHAYLFHGPRGCGKTSTARLLAAALNCERGPTPDPCGECETCVSIRDGRCLDVIEMDAASETGIDDVREKIVENVQYAPGEARYKVYIIDEVHDLSTKAFDALLKTLEDPPPHVVFVLATTELHKVPLTVRSRCQPFAFKRGGMTDLAGAVERVLKSEGMSADSEAVLAIARAAEGSWRDALSILEQVIAYSGSNVTEEAVHASIGSVGLETLIRLTETVAAGQWDATLTLADELLDNGSDVRQLLIALTGHLRDLMLLATGAKQAAIQEMGAERYELLQPFARLFTPSRLLHMMGVLATAEKDVRFTNQHRWLLERTLLNLMLPKPEQPAAEPAARTAPQATARQPVAPRSATVTRPPAGTGPTTPHAAQPAGRSPRFAEPITLEAIRRLWPQVVDAFAKVSPAGAAFLQKAEVTDLNGRTVVLGFAESHWRDRIQNNDLGRSRLEQTLNECLREDGYRVRAILVEGGDAPAEPAPPPAGTPADPAGSENGSRSVASSSQGAAAGGRSSAVSDALEVFGGEIVSSVPSVK